VVEEDNRTEARIPIVRGRGRCRSAGPSRRRGGVLAPVRFGEIVGLGGITGQAGQGSPRLVVTADEWEVVRADEFSARGER